jgi:hypothetical protein
VNIRFCDATSPARLLLIHDRFVPCLADVGKHTLLTAIVLDIISKVMICKED